MAPRVKLVSPRSGTSITAAEAASPSLSSSLVAVMKPTKRSKAVTDDLAQRLAILLLGAAKIWPRLLILFGFLLFVAAGVSGDRLPVEAILVGPALMLTGIIVSKLR
jgi:hypothetical protein